MSDIPKTGFLEEAPGVKSSARLTIIWCLVLVTILTLAVAWYLVHNEHPEAGVITAAAGFALPIATKVVMALVTRKGGEDTPAAPPAH